MARGSVGSMWQLVAQGYLGLALPDHQPCTPTARSWCPPPPQGNSSIHGQDIGVRALHPSFPPLPHGGG